MVSYKSLYFELLEKYRELEKKYEELKKEYEEVLGEKNELEDTCLSREEAEKLERAIQRKAEEILRDPEFREWVKGVIAQELYDNLDELVGHVVEELVQRLSEELEEKIESTLRKKLPEVLREIDIAGAIEEYLEQLRE
jgi:uncharacterized membrane protein YheB (UPF0754 family)